MLPRRRRPFPTRRDVACRPPPDCNVAGKSGPDNPWRHAKCMIDQEGNSACQTHGRPILRYRCLGRSFLLRSVVRPSVAVNHTLESMAAGKDGILTPSVGGSACVNGDYAKRGMAIPAKGPCRRLTTAPARGRCCGSRRVATRAGRSGCRRASILLLAGQGHAALWALAGGGATNFRMHGAGPNGIGRSVFCRQSIRPTGSRSRRNVSRRNVSRPMGHANHGGLGRHRYVRSGGDRDAGERPGHFLVTAVAADQS